MLQTPTLVLHGDDDFVPLECATRIAEALPHARLKLLAECGHFSHIEAPEAERDALDAFPSQGRNE